LPVAPSPFASCVSLFLLSKITDRPLQLVAAGTPSIMQWYDDLLADWMGPSIGKSRTVVELGAGFGHVLWSLRQRFAGKLYRGGEYTDSAVKLASLLYANHPDISVEHVNFYDVTTRCSTRRKVQWWC
jgi:hypothetical protein